MPDQSAQDGLAFTGPHTDLSDVRPTKDSTRDFSAATVFHYHIFGYVQGILDQSIQDGLALTSLASSEAT